MILDNHLAVPAAPDDVFALLNDVERVAGCLPGATLEGREGEAYRGRVKVKVGPISAAYAGTLRFTEVVPDERTLRLSARASDAHGAGDAEADVVLSVAEAEGGSTLDLHTDLLIRGKIAQFGKGAITTVSSRLLDQFARNLAGELANGSPGTGSASVGATLTNQTQHADRVRKSASSATPADDGQALDGLAMLLPPNAGRWAALAGAAGVGVVQGYLLGRLRGQKMLIEELRRDR
ncbi:SRPBCC family protein [Actinomycetospora aeridis]|uniref:SRPBCC family protein n=1 Tax=Actinomycetospora aeridis TaxID=3129231 RepID=A0ABU8MYR3_9PSEU